MLSLRLRLKVIKHDRMSIPVTLSGMITVADVTALLCGYGGERYSPNQRRHVTFHVSNPACRHFPNASILLSIGTVSL